MKKITLSYSLKLLTLLFVSNITHAQVGINTTDPKGVLDINSSTLGVVYPNVALIATDDPSPVVNPQGGAIVEGTVVYNTNSTDTNPLTDVNPGIYVWDGGKWIIHFKKRQSELHNQTALLRTQANFATDWEDVPGLGILDLKTFTALYSGLYRIEVKTNFGAGRIERNKSTFVSLASGQFRFLFDGTPYTFETSAFSAYSEYVNSGEYFEAVWKETYETRYVTLVAGQTYPFSLCFDAYDAPGFIGNGSTVIGPGALTAVDLIDEDFDGPYTVVQSHTPDGDCLTNGWEINSNNDCTACVDDHLNIHSDRASCAQNATAIMNFTPTLATVDISFDYLFRERSGRNDSFRVYIRNETTLVETDLLNIDNSGSPEADTFYTGSHAVSPGIAHTLRFEYISGRARYASVDNVIVREFSGAPYSPDIGRGYIGNEIDCQIEFTYIGE